MSDQSSVITRNSSAKHQHNNKTPRELKVEYSTISQKATVKSTDTLNDGQVIYVYCSPRLKHTLIFICRFVLIAYCVAVPVFVYLLHQKSNTNIAKIEEFEAAFSRHLKVLDHNNKEEEKGRERRDTARTVGVARKIFNDSYRQPIDKEELESKLQVFNETIHKYKLK